MKIGVITNCFKLPLDESIKLAGEMGFSGIQVYATDGEFSPSIKNYDVDTKRKRTVLSQSFFKLQWSY